MRSKLALAVLALIGAACGPVVTLAPPVAQNAAVKTAVDHTELLYPPGCTGVEVARGLVVTAKHCIEEGQKAGDNFKAGGLLAYVSPKYDFVIVVKQIRYGFDFINMRSATPGEHLYLVGYPQQVRNGKQSLTITDGIFTGVVDGDGSERISAPAYFGNSGGGVWGDDGALVGILVNGDFAETGRWPMPYPAASYMVPIVQVVAGLNDSI